MMKILFLDNMNNNFFSMARYIRDMGYHADILCMPKSRKHFRPESDDFRKIEDLGFVKVLERQPSAYTINSDLSSLVANYCKGYNIIIAHGPILAFLEKEKIKIDILIPYGSDLYELPFRKFKLSSSLKETVKSFLWGKTSYLYRRSFDKARVVIVDIAYELYGSAVEKLNIESFYPGFPMLYSRKDNNKTQTNSAMWDFLDGHDFVLFNHSRQYWASNIDNLCDFKLNKGLKRNDRLIRAYADFLESTSYVSPILILFEYGPDVNASKKLIEKLGIQPNVHWVPKLERKHIMLGLPKASLTSTAFRDGLVDIGGVCYESLAAGTPNINNISEIKDTDHLFGKCPMVHALTQEEIHHVLIDYEKNTEKYKEIGREAKLWFHKNIGHDLAKKYINLASYLLSNPKSNLRNSRKEIERIFLSK